MTSHQHRGRTPRQWQGSTPNFHYRVSITVIPCHTMSYHVIPCHTMSYHVIPCHTMSYHVIPCHTMSCHVIPCHTMSYHVIPCHTMSYHVIPCHTNILSYYHTNAGYSVPTSMTNTRSAFCLVQRVSYASLVVLMCLENTEEHSKESPTGGLKEQGGGSLARVTPSHWKKSAIEGVLSLPCNTR